MTDLLLALLALALPAEAPSRLSYDGPAGCPSEAQFVDAVASRGGELSRTSAGSSRVLVVSIHKQDVGFGGAFQVRDEKRATATREVHGRTCAEVADALAVVTAIELKTEASGAEPAVPVPAPPAPAVPPAAPPLDDRLVGHTQAFPKRTETIRVGAGDLRLDLDRGTSLVAGATVGLVPSVWLPTYSLKTTLASFVTTPEGVQRITGPVMELHVDFLIQGTYDGPGTTTRAAGGAFGMDLCQSPVYDSRGPILLLCAEYGGGFLNLETKGLNGALIQQKFAGFSTVGAVVDFQYNLSRHFFVTARMSGSFKLGDITAERADGSHIFKGSSWLASGTAGLGLRY